MDNGFPEMARFALSAHLQRFWREYMIGALALAIAALLLFAVVLAPPEGFPTGQIIVIKKGQSTPEIAALLKSERLVAHPFFIQWLGKIPVFSVKAGAYRFDQPENAIFVAARLISGYSGIPDVRITFREGEDAREMGQEVAEAFPDITASDFLAAAGPYEGYLFPDTYKFSPDATADDIVAALRSNFDDKIAGMSGSISASGHSLADIVTMASIVEKEARTDADKHIVAGILWNRISKGMPLQVDAVFGYINGRGIFAPKLSDLTIDSPYNTYKHKGLPPGPITNPGLYSLEAAAMPTKTDYLYYLTGKDGLMHYATTFTGHTANINKYM